jgi:hypothetical protein
MSEPCGADLAEEEPRCLAHVDPSCQWQQVGLGGTESPYVPRGGMRRVGIVPRPAHVYTCILGLYKGPGLRSDWEYLSPLPPRCFSI